MEKLKAESIGSGKFQAVGEMTDEEKIENLQMLIEKKKQERLPIHEKIQKIKFYRYIITMQLSSLVYTYGNYELNWRRNEIQHLQGIIDEYIRIDKFQIQIKGLFHRLTSGRRNSIAEEKRILNEIKRLKEQHQSSLASLPQDSYNSKQSVQDRVMKLIFEEHKELKEKPKAKAEKLNKSLLVMDKDISSLEKKLDRINEEVGKMDEIIFQLCNNNNDN